MGYNFFRQVAVFLCVFFFCCFGFAKEQRVVYKVTLVTVDDWKLSARYLPPRTEKPVIIFLHSLESNKSDWNPVLGRIKKLGYGYLVFDFRGHGESIHLINTEILTYESFERKGTNNEYNRMVNDVFAAIRYLNNKKIKTDRIILAGAGLGANVAVKACSDDKDIKMMALFTPTLNANRDILTVNSLKKYGKRPIFVAASVKVPTLYRETSILQAVAYLTCGSDYVTYVTQLQGDSAELLYNRDVTAKFIQWLKTPYKPEEIIVEPQPLSPEEEQNPADKEIEIIDITGKNTTKPIPAEETGFEKD